MIYYGFLICKNCNIHSDWGMNKFCPYYDCKDGERDS